MCPSQDNTFLIKMSGLTDIKNDEYSTDFKVKFTKQNWV